MNKKTTTANTTTKGAVRSTQDFVLDRTGVQLKRIHMCLAAIELISLTGYFGFIVPRGTRSSGQKKGAGGFAG
jgi:hypothetical protein